MKPKIIHITYICLLFILFVSAILSCYHDEDIEKNYLILSEWEVKIDKEWKKSGVIFWEASEEKGGINAKKHDGFGEYRIFYKVPEFLKGSQLAFFTECLDDADNTYFNNELIGKTGRMPKIKDGKIDVSSFQTGTRKARLYLLPQKSLLYDSTNEIRINIYDFAGNGGFCYPQKPLIGRYENLREKARFYQMSNDLPRFVLLTVLLFMIAYCGTKLFKEQDIKFRSVGVQFLERLNFWSFIIRRKKSVVKDNIIKENIYFHKFCGLLIFVMFFFNITEEVHFKDSFISSGEFWFRTKIIVSYSTMFILIALLHSETFGYSLEKKFSHLMNILTVFFGIITHPLFSFFLIIYFFFIPANEVYSFGVRTGVSYLILCSGTLFILTGINIVRFGIKKKRTEKGSIFIFHGFLRMFLFFSLLSLFLYFSHKTVLPEFSIYFLFLVFSYWYISLRFLKKYRLKLPIPVNVQSVLYNKLYNECGLTKKETEICLRIYKGESREKICKKLKISNVTMKSHLNSIYSKTIDFGKETPSDKHGKLQRLTVYLNKIAV